MFLCSLVYVTLTWDQITWRPQVQTTSISIYWLSCAWGFLRLANLYDGMRHSVDWWVDCHCCFMMKVFHGAKQSWADSTLSTDLPLLGDEGRHKRTVWTEWYCWQHLESEKQYEQQHIRTNGDISSHESLFIWNRKSQSCKLKQNITLHSDSVQVD